MDLVASGGDLLFCCQLISRAIAPRASIGHNGCEAVRLVHNTQEYACVAEYIVHPALEMATPNWCKVCEELDFDNVFARCLDVNRRCA